MSKFRSTSASEERSPAVIKSYIVNQCDDRVDMLTPPRTWSNTSVVRVTLAAKSADMSQFKGTSVRGEYSSAVSKAIVVKQFEQRADVLARLGT